MAITLMCLKWPYDCCCVYFKVYERSCMCESSGYKHDFRHVNGQDYESVNQGLR